MDMQEVSEILFSLELRRLKYIQVAREPMSLG